MSYCIKNNTKGPVNVLGHTIAAGKVSRQLTDSEVAQAWAAELPSGVSLVPILLEAETSPPFVSEFSPPPYEQKVPGHAKSGRLKKEKETE